jgi:hypothetical protein
LQGTGGRKQELGQVHCDSYHTLTTTQREREPAGPRPRQH